VGYQSYQKTKQQNTVMENRKKQHTDLEVVQEGFANGVAPGFPLDDREKNVMIENAAIAYGKFLTA
jgi:hypothetical protein